jgi:DNA-binding beta-propeller fold protein YncE
MRILHGFRHVAGVAALVSLGPGCSGFALGPSAPPPTSISSTRAPSVLAGRPQRAAPYDAPPVAGTPAPRVPSPTGLLYVSGYDCNCIQIYDQAGKNQQPIGQIGKLTHPQGLFVDANEQLWVSNTGARTVLMYKRGATKPSLLLNDPREYPVDVAVHTDGTVFVANTVTAGFKAGDVVVYAAGAKNPTSKLVDPHFSRVIGVAVDAKKDVFVSYIDTKNRGRVDEFIAGSTIATRLGITVNFTGGIVLDQGGNIVLNDELAPATDVYAPPNWQLTGSFGKTGIPLYLALDQSESSIYVADGSGGAVYQYAYPSGTLVNTISAGWSGSSPPYGVAVSPAAPL